MTIRPGASVLAALGFAPEVDDLYARLRPQSGRTLARVAASLLLTSEELLAQLQPLLDLGAVRLQGEHLVVTTPSDVVRGALQRQAATASQEVARLGGVARAVALFAEEQRLGVPEGPQPIEGEVFDGDTTGVHALVRTLVLRGSGDLRWLRPDQWRGPREHRMTALVGEAVAQGRRSRAIYPVRAVRDAPEALRDRVAAGEDVRVLPDLPTRLLVIGTSHAVLPEPLGLADLPLAVVRQASVVGAMAAWFEALWEQAEVPALAAEEPIADLRRFLLAELAAGARDDQIARKLGISLRTVRRRVADLLVELGADSRFQAGVEATRRGWL